MSIRCLLPRTLTLLILCSGVLLLSGLRTASVRTGRGEAEVIPRDTIPPVLQVGEELEYHVSYSFFSIGTITLKIVDKQQRNGRTTYRAVTIIDSNPSMNWLTETHIRFYGEMDEDVFSYHWLGEDSSKDGVIYRTMDFDYDVQKMYYEKGKRSPNGSSTRELRDTIPVHARSQDGLTLFFYAREHVRQKKQETIPTFIENKEQKTFIDFQNERASIDIDAVDYPVEVVHFDGRADFVGVFGLTGGFEGWFSNDDARIPIVARMKVILGSIKVELRRWKHDTWQPPKYVEQK